MARPSWPSWLVAHRGNCPSHPATNRAQRIELTSLIDTRALYRATPNRRMKWRLINDDDDDDDDGGGGSGSGGGGVWLLAMEAAVQQ